MLLHFSSGVPFRDKSAEISFLYAQGKGAAEEDRPYSGNEADWLSKAVSWFIIEMSELRLTSYPLSYGLLYSL